MPAKKKSEAIAAIVTVNTAFFGGQCRQCQRSFPGDNFFAELVTHYIEHGYRLLHVGQETSRDMEGAPWQSTVAVLSR